ncbi:MAG TPA: UDP-glucose 4-epimerase GalE [Candidatus Krumholzibacteria bacterium]|jgi:UDP-arabinose 4-epimerase|nr:UDP-glucose 4-epimerase GalE [Candidatus Krumholzibacteria bacterium]
MPHVLVTGGAGYIGSHTCKILAQRGFTPVVLDNLVHGHRANVRWGPFFLGDVADTELVGRIVREHDIRALVHFAAYAYVGESMQKPEKYFDNNVGRGLRLLQTARENGVRHVVFSSTCAVYGLPEKVPIDERQSLRPVNPYGETKLMVERALHWLGVSHSLGWMALRYFNAAGADPDGDLGELHDPETHLVPRVIQAALGQIPAVEIFGTDYDTPDGTAIRDYVHVNDLGTAHASALEYLMAGGESRAINLGTGAGCSVQEVVSAVEEISGRPVPVQFAPRRPGDPPILVADPSLARRTLDWSPRHSSLQSILQTAWDWHRSTADGAQ